MADLTLGELADAAELLDAPLHEAIQGRQQPRAIAAMVCVLQRRTDPGYTLEQALALKMADIDMVAPDTDPEKVPAGSNGGAPVLLPASGT
jgi:hypothetical protein